MPTPSAIWLAEIEMLIRLAAAIATSRRMRSRASLEPDAMLNGQDPTNEDMGHAPTRCDFPVQRLRLPISARAGLTSRLRAFRR